MKKYAKKSILIILIFTIFFLTGCSDNQNGDLKTKVISELDYIDGKVIDMLNKLNNISFESYTIISEEVKLDDEEEKNQSESGGSSPNSGEEESSDETSGQQTETNSDKINTTNMEANVELNKDRSDIDWDTIKNNIELLEESWGIITLDLYTLNVESSVILDFSNKLNTVMVEIKNEDKQASLTALADLYSSVPEFLEQIGADENMQKIRQTQSYVINAYVLADDIENTEIDSNLTQAITIYSEVMSDIDYTKDKTEKTNKIYVLLNELANSLKTKDSDIFYVKYKNFMKEIEAI